MNDHISEPAKIEPPPSREDAYKAKKRERYFRLKAERKNDPAKMEEYREKQRQMKRRRKLNNPEKVKAERAREGVSRRARKGDQLREQRRIQNMTPERRDAERRRGRERYKNTPRQVLRETWRARYHATPTAVLREKQREKYRKWKLKRGHQYSFGTQPAIGELLRAALWQNDLHRAASAAVPDTLPPDIRDDVISEMVVAVLEGSLSAIDVPRAARRFISDHFRSREWRSILSLDAVVPGTDRVRLIDTIAAE